MAMKNKWILKTLLIGVLWGCNALLDAQTIAEKKAGVVKGGGDLDRSLQQQLNYVNKDMFELHNELNDLYGQVTALYAAGAPESDYEGLLEQINAARSDLIDVENTWREMATTNGKEGGYALWHQPETTLGQLVIDYGSQRYVYLVPEEISEMKLNVDSNLPIPKGAWDETVSYTHLTLPTN